MTLFLTPATAQMTTGDYRWIQRVCMHVFSLGENWLRDAEANDTLFDAEPWNGESGKEIGEEATLGYYLEVLAAIAPGDWNAREPRSLTLDHTLEWQQAVRRLRARAFYLHWHEQQFCRGGLNDFLRACGLPVIPEMYQPTELDRKKGR